MAKIPGVNVIAPVVPFDTDDVHPSHEARYGRGGYRTVATLVERDAIPAPRREAGMLVFVEASGGSLWQLGADLTTWSEFSAGVSSWNDLADKPATFPPSAHGHTIAEVTGLQAALDSKATPADVTTAVAAVVNAAPAALDTLNELAAALGNDASFATTVTNSLAGKANASHTHTVSAITDAGTAATRNVPASGNAGSTEVVLGGDARLTDQRVPTDGSVTAAKIANGAVTPAKIAAGSQTWSFGGSVLAGSLTNASGAFSTTTGGATYSFSWPLATASVQLSNVGGVGAITVGQWQATAIAVAFGGTGATDAATARTNLGVAYGSTAGTVCQGNDARLTDSREWSAATIDQAEAEAGTATTRRAFTAQRVFQAIAAWWNASAAKTKLDGIATGATANAADAQLRDRATHTGTQAISTVSGLQTALDAKAPLVGAEMTDLVVSAGLEVVGGDAIFVSEGTINSYKTVSSRGLIVFQAGSGGLGGAPTFNVGSAGIINAGTWQATPVAVTYGGTGATTAAGALTNLGAVATTDSRLSDARTPLSHTHSASDLVSGTVGNARLTARARAAINVFNWSSFR